jgi:hypothetical protein
MRRILFATLAFAAFCGEAQAERWLRIDPNDPYGKEGSFHWFDIDSAFEDSATGWVYSWGAYKKAADIQSGAVRGRFLWAFDCAGKKVHSVGYEENGAWKEAEGWRDKGDDLTKPHMGGVTNQWGDKLCALKGSLPTRPIGP